jgi:hypothetical protein
MWFEDILLLMILASGVLLVGVPTYRYVKAVLPQRKNPLAEAKERLEKARLEVEAARLDKEREKLYEKMYKEVLQDEEPEQDTKQEFRK